MSHITERSLYHPILQQLSQLGFTGLQEVDLGGDYPDIEFWHGNERFILEVKIGTWQKKLIGGIIQTKKYAEKAKTNNVILVFYPLEIKRPLVPSLVDELVVKTPVDALVLTNYWKWDFTGGKRSKLVDILTTLKQKIEAKQPVVSLSLVIETLRESTMMLSDNLRVLNDIDLDKLVRTVVGRFDLFLALGETSQVQKDDLKMATIDLSSYLLINQILFYHIYSQLSQNVPALPEIGNIEDLTVYFKRITDINYKPIYAIDVLGNLPRTPNVNELVHDTIEAVKTISPELVSHDLLGRLFHELLPPKTRKVLAAFYTRPVAAEILATLAIGSSSEKVLDPACGSGTLLVSAYKRKMELLNAKSPLDTALSHTRFVENELMGIDIMPFAAHLSAIHLASQNFDVTTNKVLIGVEDSLRCREGMTIEPFSKTVQRTLLDAEHVKPVSSGAIGPEGKGEAFILRKVDTVIMNPPFTKEERLPQDYNRLLKDSAKDLQSISGKAAGLWGLFLALADGLTNKKIACVIPINLLRGKGSLRLREHFLKGQYAWKYLVKATENYGFTEGAEYRDILLVIERRRASPKDKLGVVFLKEHLESMSLEEAKNIGLEILKVPMETDERGDKFDVQWVSHKWLFAHKEHLMPIAAFSNLDNVLTTRNFLDEIEKRGKKKLKRLREGSFAEGFRPSPKGISQLVFITRPFHKSREEEAFMVLVGESDKYVEARIRDLDEDIIVEKASVLPSLRTTTGIKTYDISHLYDYIVVGQYPKAHRVMELSKLEKKSMNWEKIKKECENRLTHLGISRRINWYSPNVSHLAYYSERLFAPSDLVKIIKIRGDEEARIIALSLNSVVSLLQLFMHKEESTGRWLDIRTSDLLKVDVLNTTQLSQKEKTTLLTLFEELKSIEFPSYRQQLSERFWARVKLDTTILGILGFSSQEAQEMLPKIYDIIYYEMMKIRRLTKD